MGAAALSPALAPVVGTAAVLNAMLQRERHQDRVAAEMRKKQKEDKARADTEEFYRLRDERKAAEARAEERGKELQKEMIERRKKIKLYCIRNPSMCNQNYVPKLGIKHKYGLGWSSLHPKNWGWKTKAAMAGVPLVLGAAALSPVLAPVAGLAAYYTAADIRQQHKQAEREKAVLDANRAAYQKRVDEDAYWRAKEAEQRKILRADWDAYGKKKAEEAAAKKRKDDYIRCKRYPSQCTNGVPRAT